MIYRGLVFLFTAVTLLFSNGFEKLVEPHLNSPVRFEYTLEIYWDVRELTTEREGMVLLDNSTDRFYFESDKATWVSDGITVWQYNENTNQVIIQDYLDFDPAFHPANMLQRFAEYDFTRREDSDQLVYYWEDPDDDEMVYEYKSIEVHGHRDESSIAKIILVDRDDNISTYDIGLLEQVDDVSEEMFEFSVPEDAHVIDNR
ncbi:MAG: LolA family protein [Fibrobacterota bacterium]